MNRIVVLNKKGDEESMEFTKNLIKLIKTKKDYFELSELKEILSIDDEMYLLKFAKEIKEMEIGRYYPSDNTVEKLFLYREKLGKVALLKTATTIKDFIK